MRGLIGHPCCYARCPRLVTEYGKAYCTEHKQHEKRHGFRDKVPEQRTALYGTQAWKTARDKVLHERPLCERCRNHPATVVHHLERVVDRPDLALVRSNLQALCASCHNTTSQAEAVMVAARKCN